MIAGRYSLDRELGRGGMGAVWLGRDEVLGREVAVKRLGLAPGAESPDLERAEREARLAARLSHPHVVAVYDLVDEEEQQYLVMEYVEGTNLSGLLRARGPLLPDAAAALLGQAADALAAAHEAGIVHRDVKPSNMLVGEDGQLKLSDFGIARADADASLTQTGLVTGSPAYLAPEVASGGTATDASDVWSLGASLFHALTGHPPYEVTDNVLGALFRIVHEEPPRVPDPGWLGPVLEATMHRDPAARWSMAQVRDFLLEGPSTVGGAAGLPAGAEDTAALPAAEAVRAPAAAGGGRTEGTQVLSAVPAVTTGPQPVVASPDSPDSPVSSDSPGQRRGRPPGSAAAATGSPQRRGGRTVPVLLGLVAGAAVIVLAFVLGQGRGDDDPQEPTAPAAAGPSQEAPSEPEPVTAEDLEQFATSYVETAVADPAAGFELLTPPYQEASQGLDGYTGFWGGVREVTGFNIRGTDAEQGTVTYEYSYVLGNGQRRTDVVELTLEQQPDGSLLIAGARTI
ncbi:serine/threonine-protein kinase [Nocardioides sp.]|uniref:serine/threonine-protein kinase n=1 Tax=Nocardioides sp. TaxID=35761 RepID=UPI002637697C|nr:serine/threonine-protein kinase [Nocardioides sp.]